ncbi:MAG: sulfite exporter TauE/SafE family protein [Firmicutes bacterium]|nr:sulfite exporter TauE/SafE family protein [Bacillota bacterium]
MDISFFIISTGIVIILISGLIQGMTSFGFSLLALPLLGLILPIKIVVPILVIYSLVINAIIIYKIREDVHLGRIKYLIIAGIISTPLGTYLLLILNENTLKVVIGIIISISAISMLKGYKINIESKRENISYIPVGLISGILNGSVSLSGPPVILFLANQGVKKQIFRANLTSYFLILNIITIPTYFFGGLITKDVINHTIILFPALIIGVLLGIKLGNKVDEKIFKKLTLILVISMGILSIISGIK